MMKILIPFSHSHRPRQQMDVMFPDIILNENSAELLTTWIVKSTAYFILKNKCLIHINSEFFWDLGMVKHIYF